MIRAVFRSPVFPPTRLLPLVVLMLPGQVLYPQGLPPFDSLSITRQQRDQLHAFTTSHLLALLTEDSLTYTTGLGYSDQYQVAAAYELLHRRPYDQLCRSLATPLDLHFQQDWIASIAEALRGPDMDRCLRPLATAGSSYTAYYAVRYFAELGQPWAVGTLNKNFWRYHIFEFDRQDIIQIFHRFRFRPAAPHLAEAMKADNLTTVGLAEGALRAIFGISPTFTNPVEAQAFWARYVATH